VGWGLADSMGSMGDRFKSAGFDENDDKPWVCGVPIFVQTQGCGSNTQTFYGLMPETTNILRTHSWPNSVGMVEWEKLWVVSYRDSNIICSYSKIWNYALKGTTGCLHTCISKCKLPYVHIHAS
jgi:hypothetical protein